MEQTKVSEEMQKAVEDFKSELGSVRTGRATSTLVEDIEVEAYGGAQALRVQELANIGIPDPQTIVIDPWDKSVIGEIKKGIEAANVGLNPNIDGEIIRISIPPMTGEDRERLVKLLNTKIENAKIAIRQIRGDAMKAAKRREEENEISEDERHLAEKEIQKLTDEFVEKIDELGEKKREELLQV